MWPLCLNPVSPEVQCLLFNIPVKFRDRGGTRHVKYNSEVLYTATVVTPLVHQILNCVADNRI
jgi:hypothetical protein